MDVATGTQRLRSWILLLVIVGDAALLNARSLYFEPFPSWVLIGIPAALLLGLAGTVWANRPLRLVGWLGVWSLTVAVVIATIPGEEYTMSGSPESPPVLLLDLLPSAMLLRRFLLFAGSALALIVCYRWAARPETGADE